MTFRYILQSYWEFVFRSKNASRIGWKAALTPFSFRIPRGEEGSLKMVLHGIRRAFRLILSKEQGPTMVQGPYLIVDEVASNGNARLAYVNSLADGTAEFIAMDALRPSGSAWARTILCLEVALLLLLLSPYLLFHRKNRAGIALIAHDYVLLSLLDRYVAEAGITRIHWFGGFERTAPLLIHYFIQYRRVEVYLVPSANPIRNFYQQVVASVFVFTMPFQASEYEELKADWAIERTMSWPLAGHEQLRSRADRSTAPRTIGFISSGNWLREIMGRNQSDPAIFKSEPIALEWCLAFVERHPDHRLVILLHPLERSTPERLAQSLAYYVGLGIAPQDVLSDTRISVTPETVDVTVSLYSSATFERLYAGYKGVFAQPGFGPNYFPGAIDGVVALEQSAFNALLERVLHLTAEAYFSDLGLQDYRWDSTKLQVS